MANPDDAKKKVKLRQPSAVKRHLQSEKQRLRNKSFKSSVRTAIRQFDEILVKNDAELIKKNLSEVYSLMDTGVKRGVFKLNKASRTKARLAARAASKA